MYKPLNKLFFAYQDFMFLVGQFAGEYGKAGKFVNETITIVTLLAVKGINIPIWFIPIFYIFCLVVAALIGKLLIYLKIPHYNNTLNNKTNPEILEIIKRLDRIEKNQGSTTIPVNILSKPNSKI